MIANYRAAIRCAFASALLPTISTTAVAGPVWQPAGDWSIQRGDSCVAALSFNQRPQLNFMIEPDPTKPIDFVYFVTEGEAYGGRTTVDIALGTKWKFEQQIRVIPSAQPHHIIYKLGISDQELDTLEAAGRIQVRGKDLDVDLSLPGLSATRAGLRACNSALLTRWGFGSDQQAKIAHFPTIEKMNLKDSDYPVQALKRGSIGDVVGYLIVGPDGKATDCHVLDSSGWPILDSQTCQLLTQRPKYKPASDKAGRAMAAPYHFEFVWGMR